MKNIFLASLFALISTTASAQIIRVEAICFEKKIIDEIVAKTKEEIVWVGTIEREKELGTSALYMNLKTGTWSFVEHWKDSSCVVSGGDYSKFKDLIKGNPT